MEIEDIFYNKRELFDSGHTKSYDFRIHQLEELKSAIKNNEEEIFEALYKDLHKARFESYAARFI